MFPPPPLHLSDDDTHGFSRYIKRRDWLMARCDGPIVLMAPKLGPNQSHAWAHCYQPVYQDSYFLYLSGINQTGIAMVLDPQTKHHHLFLPSHNPDAIFWNGDYFSHGDPRSHEFLTALGFNAIHCITSFKAKLNAIGSGRTWHLNMESTGKKLRQNESFYLKKSMAQTFKKSFKFKNISALSWTQRLTHDDTAIDCITLAAQKTSAAFHATIGRTYDSEVALAGQLIGSLLTETPFGLAFSPIVAGNKNAAILHYTNNSARLESSDLVLLDFGLRWKTMCTDISRTIPAGGRYTDLQRRLMGIVIDTQLETIANVKPGITFNELNAIAWNALESHLDALFLSKGGRMKRPYSKQPHNIGHFLGIQVHDGDANRTYKDQPIPDRSIITIEPGLYGEFEFNGDAIHCGIRIEDNLYVSQQGTTNLTAAIPKHCDDIEAMYK